MNSSFPNRWSFSYLKFTKYVISCWSIPKEDWEKFRQTEAKKTIEKVKCIMSSEGRDKQFYRLVKDQRKTKDFSLQFLCVKGKIIESPDEICDGWATHFGSLATPEENIHFDNDVKKTYTEDINHILNICSASSDGINPASVEEVEVALKKLKANKAADCLDITCEHLHIIYGGVSVVYFLRDMINYIFECKQVPSVLKKGLLTPETRWIQRITAESLLPLSYWRWLSIFWTEGTMLSSISHSLVCRRVLLLDALPSMRPWFSLSVLPRQRILINPWLVPCWTHRRPWGGGSWLARQKIVFGWYYWCRLVASAKPVLWPHFYREMRRDSFKSTGNQTGC